MQLSLLAQALWAMGFCELVALLLVLVLRQRWRSFPFFMAYIAFQVIETALLYSVHHFGNEDAYFWTYWTTVFVDLLLQLSVVFELTRSVLKPTGTWVRDARRMFVLMGIAGTVIAAGAAFAVNPTIPDSWGNWIEKANLFAAMLNAELFVAMALASTRLGLVWRHHVMGIATGWGLWAFVGLFVEATYSYLGPNWHGVVLDDVRILAYQVATIYWAINLWLPEPEKRTLSNEMQAYLSGLQQHLKLGVQGVSTLERR